MNKICYNERVKTYTNAIVTYGMDRQIIKAVEEMSECTKEICKILRGGGSHDHMAEEIADATIMLEQLRLIFDNNDEVCRYMDEKIMRLDAKLKGGAYNE